MCIAALAQREKGAMWLVAATEDRFLMGIGRKQRFGTQYEAAAEPGRFCFAPTDPQVTDELRAAVGAPPLSEAKATEGRFDNEVGPSSGWHWRTDPMIPVEAVESWPGPALSGGRVVSPGRDIRETLEARLGGN
jgi:hypothetical protein